MLHSPWDMHMVQTISSEDCYTHPEIYTWCRPSPRRSDRRQPLSSVHGRDTGLRPLLPWCRCPSFYPQSWRWVIPAIWGAIKRKKNNRWTFLRNTLRLPIQTLISMAPTRLVFWRTTQFQENEHNPELKHCLFLVTTRKRSLGQGNMFTSVCLSTGGVPAPGGCLLLGGAWSWGVPGPGSAWSRERVPGPEGLVQEGAWSWGTCSWGGAWWRPPRLLLRAVRILLECILVNFDTFESDDRMRNYLPVFTSHKCSWLKPSGRKRHVSASKYVLWILEWWHREIYFNWTKIPSLNNQHYKAWVKIALSMFFHTSKLFNLNSSYKMTNFCKFQQSKTWVIRNFHFSTRFSLWIQC